MLLLNTVVRAEDERFSIRNQYVDPLQHVITRRALLGVDNLFVVNHIDIFYDVVGRKSIGADCLTWSYALCQNRLDLLAVNIIDHFHFGEGDGFIFHGGHDYDRHFACSTPAFVATLVDTSFEKGVIDLDEARQLVSSVADFHSFADLVQHGPGALEADIYLSGQCQSREPSFICADEENGPEPFDQGRSGPVHDCACGEGCLVLAFKALIQHAFFNAIRLMTTTIWASKAFRPTQSEESLLASFFCRELFLERNEVHLAVGLGHENLHNQLISLRLCQDC